MRFREFGAALIVAALLTLGIASTATAQGDTELSIGVYRATMQRDAEHLVVREAYSFVNSTDSPLTPPGGSLVFDLPHDIHGAVEVTMLSAGERTQDVLIPDTTDPALHRLETVLATGRTTVTLSYSFHYGAETPFQPRLFYPMARGQLFVQPEDIHIHGTGVTKDADSPMQGFASWTLAAREQPAQLDLVLSGGTAPSAIAETPPAMTQPSAQEEWRVLVRDNRFAQGQTPVLIGLFLATVLGLGLLYGINSGSGASHGRAAQAKLTADLTRLEDRFVSGQITREDFLQQRERIVRSSTNPQTKSARKRQPVG